MNKRAGIYKILNTANGKVYVGSAVNLHTRWITHRHRLNNSKHHSIRLQSSWDLYGEASFSFVVLEYVDDTNQLLSREQTWMDNLAACGKDGYNVAKYAGNCIGVKQSASSIAKRVAAHLGRKNTEETKMRMSEAGKKRLPVSDETKAKISAAGRARFSKKEEREAQSMRRTGVKSSDETKKKIAESLRGKPHSEERKQKIKEGMARKKAETSNECKS